MEVKTKTDLLILRVDAVTEWDPVTIETRKPPITRWAVWGSDSLLLEALAAYMSLEGATINMQQGFPIMRWEDNESPTENTIVEMRKKLDDSAYRIMNNFRLFKELVGSITKHQPSNLEKRFVEFLNALRE